MKLSKFCLVILAFIFPLTVSAIDINSCQTLTEPNSLYALNQNIFQPLDEDCIVIAAENITIDCQGYSITSSSKSGNAGIYSNRVNTTIKNCKVSMGVYSPGIELLSANNSYIFNNTLNNQADGMFLTDVNNVLIENNTANFNGFNGIVLTTDWGGSSQNTLIGNTANGNYAGIRVIRSNLGDLIGNAAESNSYAGIWAGSSSNNNLIRNTAGNNSKYGIILQSSSNNTIKGNNVNKNSQYGIYVLSSSSNNNLRENKFCFNSDKDVYCADNQTFINNWCDLSKDVCGGTCLLCSEYGDVCTDGTANRECSIVNPPLYCDFRYLVLDPNKCGADVGKCCQSYKHPTYPGAKNTHATFLATNIPLTESCDNAYLYFNESYSGIWANNSFFERPGIATVIGGYPTNIICQEIPFDVMPPRPSAGRPPKLYHGVRYKNNSCIFAPWSDNIHTGDLQKQAAILDWNYSKNSYCIYDGKDITVKEINYPNITLYPGWNLISLPLIPTDPSIEAVMQGCDYNKIWAFESDQSWKSTDTGLSSMDIKHGYWVDRNGLEGNCEMAIKGTIPHATTINVYSQWTLAGYPSVTSGLISSTIPEGLYDKIWAFESDHSWKSTDTGLTNMKYGKGYWIDSSIAGSYNITN